MKSVSLKHPLKELYRCLRQQQKGDTEHVATAEASSLGGYNLSRQGVLICSSRTVSNGMFLVAAEV